MTEVATKKTTAKAAEEEAPKTVFGAQESFEITETDGTKTKYLLQFPGTDTAQKILANAQLAGQGILDSYSYRKDLMKQVIVQPRGLNYDFFDEHNGFMEVMDKADTFLFGKLDRSAE